MDEAKRRGLTVVPLCPFARDWLVRHPDVAATVPVDGLG
jgi:predicted GNAT family acetyltransferase